MLAYRQLNGAYTFVAPGTKYPQVQPQAPTVSPDYPVNPTPKGVLATWAQPAMPPSQNTSGQAMVDLMDETPDDPGTRPSTVTSPPVPQFDTTPVPVPPKRIVGVSPFGLMAIGAGLVATWAIFRK